jgi:hypothetical protein
MTDDKVDRRGLLARGGAAALAALAGCSGVFTDAGSDETPTPTSAPTQTPTPTATPTATPSRTPGAGSVIEVTDQALTVGTPGDGTMAVLDVAVDFENVGERTVTGLNLRIDVVYRPDTQRRTVTVDYVGTNFDGDEDDGLPSGDVETLRYETRFPRDGRAEKSTDADDFGLQFQMRRIEFA